MENKIKNNDGKLPLISIIVPVYNVEKYLPMCLDSILAQTYENIEILLINDGSTDGSHDICRKYAENDKRIKLFSQENKGLSAARNKGLDNASGEYIGFVDSDDWIAPEMYEVLYSNMIEHNAQISVCGRFVNLNYQNKFTEMKTSGGKTVIYSDIQALIHLFTDTSLIRNAVWDKLYEKSFFDGLRFTEGLLFEDADITYKILYKSRKTVATNNQLYAYSLRSDSIMNSCWSKRNIGAYKNVVLNTVKYFSELNEEHLVQCSLYRGIQFGIDTWERLLLNSSVDKADFKGLQNYIIDIYKKLNISELNFGTKKRFKKKIEFFLFAYFPNLLCALKKFKNKFTVRKNET